MSITTLQDFVRNVIKENSYLTRDEAIEYQNLQKENEKQNNSFSYAERNRQNTLNKSRSDRMNELLKKAKAENLTDMDRIVRFTLKYSNVSNDKFTWDVFNNELSKMLFSSDGYSFDSKEIAEYSKHRLISRGFEFIGYGRNRIAFLSQSKKNIIKIPITQGGVADNTHEHISWSKFRKKLVPIARCRLLKNSVILVMELITRPYHPYDPNVLDNQRNKNFDDLIKQNPWIDFVDCGQVGLNRKGQLVAYDFGLT